MSVIEFRSSDQAPPDYDGTPAPGDGQLQCGDCGAIFDHSGRGRKPKKCPDCRTTSGTSVRSSRNVESALAVLDGIYQMLTMTLMLTGASPELVADWNRRVAQTQLQNRVILTADPKLCAKLNRAASKGGTGAFALAQAMLIIPVAFAFYGEVSARRLEESPDSQT